MVFNLLLQKIAIVNLGIFYSDALCNFEFCFSVAEFAFVIQLAFEKQYLLFINENYY